MKTHLTIFRQWFSRLHPLMQSAYVRTLLVSALCCLASPASAATRSWTGDVSPDPGGYRYWSHADNWSPNGAPQNGEDLWFSDPFSPDVFMVNDLTNLTVRTLKFAIGDIGDASVHLYGYPLGISHGISNTFDFECQVYIHCGVTLAGNATFVTGNTVDNPAVFSEETAMHLIGPIDLNGHNLVLKADASLSNEGRLFVEGGISGSGNVVAIAVGASIGYFDYWGIVELKGAGNDYSGTLTLNPELLSEIRLNVSSGFVVNDRLNVTNVGAVTFVRPEQIGPAATVRLQDGAKLQFHSSLFFPYTETFQNLELITDSNDSRPTSVDSGVAMLSLSGNITSICNNSAQTPAIKGMLNLLSGSHDIYVSGSVYEGLDMQAQMTGFGNFSKSGNAALLLQASNSFNSSITILQGVLDVRNNHGLGDIAGSTTIAGGNLTLRNLAIGAELLFALGPGTGGEMPGAALTSIGASSWAGQVALYTNLVVTGGDMTFTSPISGAGGLGCFSSGTMRLGGTLANTYTGPTLVRCPLLELDKPFGVHAYAGPLVVGAEVGGPTEVRWFNSYLNPNTSLTLYANGVVNLGWSNVVENFGPVIFNGGTVQTGTGSFIAENTITANPATTTATMNGNLVLGVSPAYFVVSNGVADPDLRINAAISGANIIKQGPGTLTLAGINTYSGSTVVAEGMIQADNAAAFGSLGENTTVGPGATIRLNTFVTVPESFALLGTGVGGTNGAIHVTGNPTVTGSISLNGPATINVAPGASLAVDSVISGTGPLTKTGPGNLFLGGISGGAGNNNYSGSTIVTAGTLYLSKNQNVLSVPGPLVVGPATAASPATARFSRSGTMVAAGTVTVSANSLLDLNGNNQTLAALNLNDGGDVQTGTGQLNFPAGGLVTVGTLNAPQVGLLASSSISGKIGLPVLDYLTFNVGGYGPAPLVPDAELVIPALISGGGNIIKNGAGSMLLSGANTFNDSPPNVAGDLYIYEGIVIAANSTALGGPAGWTLVYNGARLALVGNITVIDETLYLNSTNTTTLDHPGGHNIWLGPIIQARDSSIGVNLDWSLTVAGTVSGTGSLTKKGAGLLRLGGSANNTHSGDTFVDAGSLWLTKFPNMQAVPANLIIGRPEGGTPATVMHVNADLIWGNVTVNNGGLLNVNGYDEHIGNLTLNGGGDVQTGAGILHIVTDLTVNPGSFADQSVISGRLGIASGTRQFNVNPGSLAPGVADCLINAIISPTSHVAGFQKNGAGRLQLTANNTYNGNTTVSSGTVQIDGLQPQSPVQVFGGRLQGSGTVGHVIFDESKCFLAPGSSPGILTTSNLNATALGGAKVEIELNGPGAGSGYDQINVRGTVNLSQLSLGASLGFASSVGQQFTIISNDGSDAVTGTFTSLPQNAQLHVGSELFQINYAGGDGNDVVLSRLVTAPLFLHLEKISTTKIRLYWSTNYPDFHLEYNASPGTTNWAASALTPVVTGTNLVVTNSLFGAQKYYRLSRVPASFIPPPPVLTIQSASAGAVRLLWPAEDDRTFSLQSHTNLTTTNWTTVSPSPAILGWNHAVTNPISGAQKYYRLLKP